MHPTRRRPGSCYRGFAKALRKRSPMLLEIVVVHLRGLLQRQAIQATQWLTHGFAVFGVDSTRQDCPMTRANEGAIGTAGKRKSWPQLVLTMVFHARTNVPWAFKRGDAKSSERAHLLDLLATLPPQALVLADAGFVGYSFFNSILASKRHFLVRIGANVKLIQNLCGMRAQWHGVGVVHLWPDKARKKNLPPLVLRRITVIDPRRNRRMHLLTSVLDPAVLGDEQLVDLYGLRWSIELKYRSLKQVMGRRKLLSDSPALARIECDWSCVGLWMLEMMSWRESRTRKRSVASALRAVRASMTGRSGQLGEKLRSSVGDTYERTRPRKARHWPHKKRDRPPGDPIARTATTQEVAHAAKLTAKAAAT
jgi:hypothetical protein